MKLSRFDNSEKKLDKSCTYTKWCIDATIVRR